MMGSSTGVCEGGDDVHGSAVAPVVAAAAQTTTTAAAVTSKPKMSINLSNDEKLALCEYAAKHPGMSQRALSVWAQRTFDLLRAPSQATVSNILKKRDALRSMLPTDRAAKRQRTVKHPALDRALANWVLHTLQHSAQAVTGSAIKKKAAQFAALLSPPSSSNSDQLQFSNGWLDAFKARHGLKRHVTRAQAQAVIDQSLPALQQLTSAFARRDVFAFGAFGLHYAVPPDRSIDSTTTSLRRRRLTLAVCVNADGSERFAPLFVGRTQSPASFCGRSALALGFQYATNARASMSALVFRNWLQQFDERMRAAGRYVLLLLDAAAVHTVANLAIANVRVAFLPVLSGAPHDQQPLQPLLAGVIAAFKRRYRRLQLAQALDRQERHAHNVFAVSQRQAMGWSLASWHELPCELIQESWRCTGLLLAPVLSTVSERVDPVPTPSLSEPMTESLVASATSSTSRKSREELAIETDVRNHIAWLGLLNPMSVSELLRPDDVANVYADVNDDDVDAFVGCAIEREGDSERDDDVYSDDDSSECSDAQKLQHISQVLRFIGDFPCERTTATDLRNAQRALRERIAGHKRLDRSIEL